MNNNKKIILGISIGDINGIGIEIILKTFSDRRMLDFCTPIIFGSTKVITRYRKQLENQITYNGIQKIENAISSQINVFNIWRDEIDLEIGKPTEISGKCAFESLEKATKCLQNNEIDILVTAPISKKNIQSNNFNFPGHTEYLESKLEGESLMILMTDDLRVGLITGHIPISEVSKIITPELITKKINILHNSLKRDFAISKPKIAILGLNPHCGDNGVIGKEDNEIILPTIKKLQDSGKLIFGPYPADSFFGSANYKNFDAVIAMYHDQGLAPFKTISFGKGVNYTAGLNKIRTSPDHGTAFEMAGKNEADFSSFREAIYKAIHIYRTREDHDTLSENPLKINARLKRQ